MYFVSAEAMSSVCYPQTRFQLNLFANNQFSSIDCVSRNARSNVSSTKINPMFNKEDKNLFAVERKIQHDHVQECDELRYHEWRKVC